jgi:hypothetical protein
MKPFRILGFLLAFGALAFVATRVRDHFEQSKLAIAQEEATRAAIEQQLRTRLAKGDPSEKVERVLKEMNLKWSHYPKGDGVHCAYGARRDLHSPAFVGVEVLVSLEDNVWRFTSFEVRVHHPFI